jgi:hypothetical protein
MTRLAPGDGMNKGRQLLTLRAVYVALDKIAPRRGTDVTCLRWIVIAYVIVFASSALAED